MKNELRFNIPLDHKALSMAVETLSWEYSFVRPEILGYSLLNRPIYGLRMGVGREKVLLCGSFHGMEWITGLLLLNFIDTLGKKRGNKETLAGVDIVTALSTRQMLLVPVVNPDGVEIQINGAFTAGGLSAKVFDISGGDTRHWQANARGVDINHNFNAGWHKLHQMEEEAGITGPAKTRYGGCTPESEPETRILTSLCRNESFRHVYAFHSQGEEIYWEYGEKTPVNSRIMAKIMASVSGYTAASITGMASHGGFKDWFIEEFERPGFTVEVGFGENPLPITDLPDIYQKLEEMLMICAII